MMPFLQNIPYDKTLTFSKALYTKEAIVTLQKTLDNVFAIQEDAEKFFIDITSVTQNDCLEILNFCLYQTKKQKK